MITTSQCSGATGEGLTIELSRHDRPSTFSTNPSMVGSNDLLDVAASHTQIKQ
ncbi:MAG: hypothetical protein HC899_39810 [Leptolyngbyaceae cyanobacterium SM1_4_3]|nr:hypothetical protein [Leptolyngbyaceae cyanobacterium SM1_4_3]